MSKNGQLGFFLYKLFQDHRGTLKELYIDMDHIERDKLMNRLNRELNPDDDGAKLGIGTVEDLLIRISDHKQLSVAARSYLEGPLESLVGLIERHLDYSEELNGYIDDDALRAIEAIAKPGMARVRVENMSIEEMLRYLGYFKSASDAINIAIQELKRCLSADRKMKKR